MPVAGLPTALDSALEALLTENAVASWKISAEGRKTTVVLRLVTTTDPDMANFTHPYTTTQHFRRKPPSRCDAINAGPPNGQDRTQRQVNILLLVYFNQHHRQQQQ